MIDLAKARVEQTFPHEKPLTSCRFSPCGRYVFAGSTDFKVYRWELETGRKSALEGHTSWISGLAFAGDRLLSADLQGGLRCWDGDKPAWTVRAHEGWLRGLASDGARVATAGFDRAARVWSAADGKLLREFKDHPAYVFSAALHPDGKSLVTGDLFGVVRHWDLESGRLVRELDAKILHTRGEDFLADVGGVRSLAFDPEGRRLAASGLREAKSNTFCPGLPTVVLFEWADGAKRQLAVKEEKTDGPVNRTRFLPDGTLAGVGEGQSLGALWFWREGAEPVHSVNAPSAYDLDLRGEQLAAAVFESKGRGGNGRHTNRGEYVSNAGSVRIYGFTPPPPKPKK